MHFPDLEATWLATADRLGKVAKTALLLQIEAWICAHRPILVVIDSIAAVFDGEAVARRQVRSFLVIPSRAIAPSIAGVPSPTPLQRWNAPLVLRWRSQSLDAIWG